jgi:hypothetical protein
MQRPSRGRGYPFQTDPERIMTSTPPLQPSNNHKWLTIFLAVSGWMTALGLGLLDLPERINKFYKELPQAAENTGIWPPIDKRFAGAWKMVPQCTTDPYEVGDLDNPDEKPEPKSHGLDLELTFRGQVVNGEIMTDELAKNYVTPEVAMVGRAVGPTAHMRVVDWMNGKAITVAWVDVSRVGDNCLDFTATTDGMKYFPMHASLARQSDEDYKRIPRRYEMLERVIQKVSAKQRANTASK